MATTMTLLQLRDASKQRSDMVNSTFVSDTEWNSYINQSAFELYDLLVQKYGDNYYIKQPASTFTSDGTNDFYALPADFYKLVGLDLQVNGSPTRYITLRPFEMAERNRYWWPVPVPVLGYSALRYKLFADSIWLTPLPMAGMNFRVWYVPRMTTMSNDSDTLEGVSGWTEYVIVDAAIKAMQKEESDVSVLQSQKVALIERIEAVAENRDAGFPQRVSDTQTYSDMTSMGQPDSWWGY